MPSVVIKSMGLSVTGTKVLPLMGISSVSMHADTHMNTTPINHSLHVRCIRYTPQALPEQAAQFIAKLDGIIPDRSNVCGRDGSCNPLPACIMHYDAYALYAQLIITMALN